jgi:hypothetical protein
MKKYLLLSAALACGLAFALDDIALPTNIYDGDAVKTSVTALTARVVVLEATVGTNSPTAAITVGSLTTTGTVTIAEGQLADSTIVSADIKDGTIVNADINASAAIAVTKIANVALIDTNAASVVTLSTPLFAGQLLVGGTVAPYDSLWVAKGTTTNDWLAVVTGTE